MGVRGVVTTQQIARVKNPAIGVKMAPSVTPGSVRDMTTTTTTATTTMEAAELQLPPLPVLRAMATHPGDKVAVIDYPAHPNSSTPVSHSYTELLQNVALGRQSLLHMKGVSDLDGARVAFLVENGLRWVSTLLSIWAAGGVAVPLCTSHPAREMAYVVRDSGADVVLGSERFMRTLGEVVEIVKEEEGGESRIYTMGVEGLFGGDVRRVGEGKKAEEASNRLERKGLITCTTTSLPVCCFGLLHSDRTRCAHSTHRKA